VPLSQVRKEYQVNPATDLVPVCPNCHAVIHHGGQLRAPEQVRELLQKSANPGS
jgi:5-methylcytosine-specific restriction protein A